MYISRVIFGCGFAMVQICTYTVVSLWFGKSKWNSFALVIIGQTVEIGILIARYTVRPLYDLNNSFWEAYGIGIVWSALSIITTCISAILERNFSQNLEKQWQKENERNNNSDNKNKKQRNRKSTDVKLTRDFGQIKQFPIKIWLIMILIVIGWSNIETFASQMTEPLIVKYNISEWYADIVLSASTFVAFTVGPLTGIIASKFGRKTLDTYVILTQIFMFIACFIYLIPNWNHVFFAWLCVIVSNLGLQTFYAGIFPLLFIECPAYLISVANSINALFYLIGGFTESFLFGLLGDVTGTWDASIIMIMILCVIGLIIGIIFVKLP